MSRSVAFVIAAVVATAFVVRAQDAPPSTAETDRSSSVKGADVTLIQTVRAVGERIAAIVRAPARPEFIAVRADETVRGVEARARAERRLAPEIAAARGRAWSDLGLGGESDPADLLLALELDLAGMTFDGSRSRLLVDPSRLTDTTGPGDTNDEVTTLLLATGVAPDETAAGHYLAHVLTDGGDPAGPPTTDALLARAALSEGSANVAALLLLFGGVGLEAEVVAGKLRPDDVLAGRLVGPGTRAASPLVASLMEFIYLDGFAQAATLAREGGFRGLAAERKRRITTRDVLHLDRPATPSAEVPAPPLPPSVGLVPVDRDSLGEQGIVALVSLVTGKDNLGMIAGDGWVADTVWRFEKAGPSGAEATGLTVWVSRWGNAEEAKDFAYSLERCLQARFPGEAIADAGAGVRSLIRTDRAYRLEQTGSEVLFRVAEPSIERRLVESPKKKAPERPTQPKNK